MLYPSNYFITIVLTYSAIPRFFVRFSFCFVFCRLSFIMSSNYDEDISFSEQSLSMLFFFAHQLVLDFIPQLDFLFSLTLLRAYFLCSFIHNDSYSFFYRYSSSLCPPNNSRVHILRFFSHYFSNSNLFLALSWSP